MADLILNNDYGLHVARSTIKPHSLGRSPDGVSENLAFFLHNFYTQCLTEIRQRALGRAYLKIMY